MAIGAKSTVAAPIFFGNDVAPFIYFDGAYSILPIGGEMTIELAARTFMPVSTDPDARLKVRPVTVAHLRCSFASARQLYDALSNALGSIEEVQKKPPPN